MSVVDFSPVSFSFDFSELSVFFPAGYKHFKTICMTDWFPTILQLDFFSQVITNVTLVFSHSPSVR